ncbi:b6dd04a0-71f3-4e5d-bf9a-c208ad9381f2 [Sclerotinia trifoliorum]|uniref:B6dd04a0-71f3-4e5d-bf9a-c208ad9381f2 n=1 Tax=Sclerotinia trifoliorum TaxID=28548 RepID=A0A8H2W4E9_9HELO|nr:b6dd04a0-71f3-4e5d-bf9a-c208ad9381f2 [Sclerotinia trifoliorum]
MSSETSAEAVTPVEYQGDFEKIQPQSTAYVKWDVKGGGDRTHEPNINTNYTLEGSPNIQGVEIKSTVDVKLICWSGAPGSGTPNITIDGPTNGKHKIDPRRLGGYRVEIR